LKLNEILTETSDGLVLKDKYVRVFVQDEKDLVTEYRLKHKTHRRARQISFSDENPEEQENAVKQVEIDRDNQRTETFEKEINEEFEKIRTSSRYQKNILAITKARRKFMNELSLERFITLLRAHQTQYEAVFSKLDACKRADVISSAFTPLEQRLISIPKYYDTFLESDEIQAFKNTLRSNSSFPTRLVPFNLNELQLRMKNYSVVICSVREILRLAISNRYGFNNLIYLEHEKSTPTDPFSFYILEYIERDKRYWKLESRLEDLSHVILEELKTYCIEMFRKIYFDIYGDQRYRKNFKRITIGTPDLEQLILNIKLLFKPREFNTLFRELIRTECVFKQTVLDKFALTSNDRIQMKRFSTWVDEDQTSEMIERMFDVVSDEPISLD
jgi:hypothetical protein